MVKKVGLAILLFGIAQIASAAGPIVTDACEIAQKKDLTRLENTAACKSVLAAPEIDPASAIAGLTLLLGGIAVIRGRRVKTLAE